MAFFPLDGIKKTPRTFSIPYIYIYIRYGKSSWYLYIYILGVQISSVRFLFKNAFISKQNEWTDQLKYCPSLPTYFFPSLRQFSNSTKEVNRWLAASLGTTSNQKEQCPENTASAVKHPIWAFPNIFLRL